MISATTKYALRALVQLGSLPPGESVAGRELAVAADIPKNYLAKMLQVLAGAGLIHAVRGVGGGYRLLRRPEQIYLIEIIELFDRTCSLDECLLDGLHPCSDATGCAAHASWREVKHAFRTFIERTTVATLISTPAKPVSVELRPTRESRL